MCDGMCDVFIICVDTKNCSFLEKNLQLFHGAFDNICGHFFFLF